MEALLAHIADIVDKHTDSEVLENASKVMELLCEDDYAISPKCQTALDTLVDSLVQKYNMAYTNFFSGVRHFKYFVVESSCCGKDSLT